MINVSAEQLQNLATQLASPVLDNGRQEATDCPHCTNGSVTHQGSMSWQTTTHRCSYCQGTGRVSAPATSDHPSPNNAEHADALESGPDSSKPARGVSHE